MLRLNWFFVCFFVNHIKVCFAVMITLDLPFAMLLGVFLPFESISENDNKQRITIKYQIEKCQDS